MRGFLFFLVCIGWGGMARAELEAPVLQFPSNGESIQLVNNSSDLQLRWSRVADATGYLLDVSGPPGFGSFNNADIEQEPSNPIVTYSINQLVAGDYVWSVSAVTASMVGMSTAATFKILSGTAGGGDLTPPILLFPPDLSFTEVASTRVTFKWAPVAEASHYLLQLPGEFPAPITVGNGMTQIDISFLPQGSKIYRWNVTAVNEEQTEGEVSVTRQFLLTRHHWSPTEILYRLSSDWFSLGSVLNVVPDPPAPQGEPITNHFEANALIPYQKGAKPKVEVGVNGPTPTSPGQGAEVPLVDSNNDLLIDTRFEWQFPNPDGYEFQLLDENQKLLVTHLLPHPTGVDPPSTRISRTTGEGDFFWRVRALKNNASEASPYSDYRAFSIVSPIQ